LCVLAVRPQASAGSPAAGALAAGRLPGLPDAAFETDGQITRRELRVLALAALRPGPGERLWDVGAGSGSIGIEWLRAEPLAQATAIEARADRCERAGRNAAALGVPGLDLICGRAPQALAALPAPDAVFIGGGLTADGVLEACWQALRPGWWRTRSPWSRRPYCTAGSGPAAALWSGPRSATLSRWAASPPGGRPCR
jgi:precorrin-6Y C5,15-methyltransferase (decarboxylating) CbiT subunit